MLSLWGPCPHFLGPSFVCRTSFDQLEDFSIEISLGGLKFQELRSAKYSLK